MVCVCVCVCVGGGGGVLGVEVELHQFPWFRWPLVDINFYYYEVMLHAE